MSGLWEQSLTVHGLEVAKQGWDGALGKCPQYVWDKEE
jgi:hypothetical protein